MKTVKTARSFNWDKGNIGKNKKHAVTEEEAEEPFFDERKKTTEAAEV